VAATLIKNREATLFGADGVVLVKKSWRAPRSARSRLLRTSYLSTTRLNIS